jgi:hypothetical protein
MPAAAVTKTRVPAAITTPSSVATGLGTLEFTDGYPTGESAEKLRDHLDYLHGVETFMNTIQGVSVYAIRQAFLEAGIEDGDVLIFSELMDSRTLALTANADTVYFWTFLDLSHGPLVLETPADTLGLLDDIWFRWAATSVSPARTAARAARTCWPDSGTTGRCPRAAATSVTRAPITCSLSAVRSSTRTRAWTPPRLSPASRTS